MWLRALLAITCFAVLAMVGYYSWGEYQRSQDEARIAEIARERDNCRFFLDSYANKDAAERSEGLQTIMEHCVNSGLISADDINAAHDRWLSTLGG